MANTLEQIANVVGSCNSPYYVNSGTKGKQMTFGTPTSIIALRRGTVIPKETIFDVTYINSLTSSRVGIPVIGATNFERQSAEDTNNTKSSGVERLNLLGLPKYALTYEEGHEFYRELSKITSYKELDFIIFDETGKMRIAVNSNGDFKGFTAGQVIAAMTMDKVQGGEDEGKVLTIQFTNRKQWDMNYAIMDTCSDQLGFDINEDVMGVNSGTPVFNSIPAAGTTLDVKVVLDADMSTPISGLSNGSEFKLVVGGVEQTVTTVTETTVGSGEYALTVPTLTASSDIELSLSVDPIELDGFLYAAGGTSKATVIA